MPFCLSIVIGDDVVAVELPDGATLDQLRASVAAQRPGTVTGTFVREGAPLIAPAAASASTSATTTMLSSLGVKDGDLLMLILDEDGGGAAAGGAGGASNGVPSAAPSATTTMPDPATALAALRADPAALAALPPPLQAAVRAGDLETLGAAMRLMAAARPPPRPSAAASAAAAASDPSSSSSSQRQQQRRAIEAEIDALNADPFDPEAQKKIAELLRKQAVEENLEHAIEHAPEAFAEVVMLYVDLKVNGVPMKAFVDSGAQRSIMSRSAAERCNILRLLDTRFAGLARGVGAGVICGRVHAVPVVVGGSSHVSMSVTVMEQESMPFLFGLDMLRRFQCSIDLGGGGGGVLRFPTLDVSLPFLSEHEIPHAERFEEEKEKASASASASASAAAAAEATAAGGNKASNEGGGGGETAGAGGATAGATAGGGAGAPSANAAANATADPDKVARLSALGFDPEAAARALVSAGGNEELAASLLFGDA